MKYIVLAAFLFLVSCSEIKIQKTKTTQVFNGDTLTTITTTTIDGDDTTKTKETFYNGVLIK